MHRILFFCVIMLLCQPISIHAVAGPHVENNVLKKDDNATAEIRAKIAANGDGLFKVGLITISIGAVTTLVGSVIRWSSQDAAVKQKAGYLQFSGLCLMGIPLGISITSNNARTSVSSTRRSRDKRRWRH